MEKTAFSCNGAPRSGVQTMSSIKTPGAPTEALGGRSKGEEPTGLFEQFLQLVEPNQIRTFVPARTGSDFLKALDKRETPFDVRH